MTKKAIPTAAVIIFLSATACSAACCAKTADANSRRPLQPDLLDQVLQSLRQQTGKLRSYRADVEYLFRQPLFESQTLRKGVLYYAKFGTESRLRIDFQTLRQDDDKEKKYLQQFFFDGLWLTQIDHPVRSVKRWQMVDPNQTRDPNVTTDAFELLSRNFPIIGFSPAEDLKKQFDIKLVAQEHAQPSPFMRLHLKVRPDSLYKDDYNSIDFWVDARLVLPARIVALGTQGDIYEIQLLRPAVNEPMDKRTFDFQVPKDYTVEQHPHKQDRK